MWFRARIDLPELDDAGAAAARASLNEAGGLLKARRFEESLGSCESVLKSVSGLSGSAVEVLAGEALELKGRCLSQLGRAQEEIGVWEEVVSRLGTSTDRESRARVARALSYRGAALHKLGCSDQALLPFDELIGRFGDASEPEVRRLVVRALLGKALILTRFSRLEEADAVRDQLIARHDAGLDPRLDRNIADCMADHVLRLGRTGRLDEQARVCAEVRRAFGGSSDPKVGQSVLRALFILADDLKKAGRPEEALAAFDEIEARFRDIPDVEVRSSLVTTLLPRAALLAGIGRVTDAIAVYDLALALIGDVRAPEFNGAAVAVLAAKGQVLRLLGRAEESIVVLDGAVSAYRAVKASGGGTNRLGVAVTAMIAKLEQFSQLDRGHEVRQLSGQLTGLLDDVHATSVAEAPDADTPLESDLAAAVADIVHGEGCWSCFDATEQTQPRALMAERAVDLYLLTEPWVFPGEPDAGVATHAAAGLVRGVADGYALLATSWSASDRLGLLLPRRTDAWMTQVRECHIDEWAAEHGCRLTLPEPRLELAHASIEPGPDEQALGDGVFSEENLVRFFLTMAYLYEWLGILTDSPTGRTALTTTNAKNHACSQLLTARKWLRWITRNREEDTGAAAACLYIAQQLFIASHAEIPRYAAPRRRMPSLRELLRESGSYERLVAFAGSLPDWVTEDDQ